MEILRILHLVHEDQVHREISREPVGFQALIKLANFISYNIL